MTLHISAASIHGLVAVCAVAHSDVTYNYSPLHGESATDSNLEGYSWNQHCAAVILLMLNQADRTGQQPNNRLLKVSVWFLLRKANYFCGFVQMNCTAPQSVVDKKSLQFFMSFSRVCTHACIVRGHKRGVNHAVQEIKIQASQHSIKPSYICITSQQSLHCVHCALACVWPPLVYLPFRYRREK